MKLSLHVHYAKHIAYQAVRLPAAVIFTLLDANEPHVGRSNTVPPCWYCDRDADTIHRGKYVCHTHRNHDPLEVLLP